MSVNDLTNRIIHELNRFRDLVPHEGFGKREWTAGVKNAMLCAGRYFGYKIINASIDHLLVPSQLREEYPPPDYGEWIYDLSIQDVQDGRWSNVVIAECEWGDAGAIRDDFEKLVVGRAALRVMVYENHYAEPDVFCRWIDLHQGNCPGDTYLLVAYQGSAKERLPLLYRRIIVQSFGAALIDHVT